MVLIMKRNPRSERRVSTVRHTNCLFVALVAGMSFSCVTPALAQVPSGATVRAGSVSFAAPAASQVVITQSSARAVIDWRTFSIGAGNSVQFIQPNASAIALNRVTGSQASLLQGSLSANGQVWLINPAGVYFGPGAQVNVGGLVASTLNLADNTKPAQLQGAVSAGNDKASVVNEGRIQTAEGGYAALMAGNVSNPGNITSPGGRILLLGDKQNGSVSLSGRLDTSSAVSNSPGFIETSAALVRIADTARVSAFQ